MSNATAEAAYKIKQSGAGGAYAITEAASTVSMTLEAYSNKIPNS
jgi:hypothetical protein